MNKDGIYFGELRCRRLKVISVLNMDGIFYTLDFLNSIDWILNRAASEVLLSIMVVTLCAFRLVTVSTSARCVKIE